MSNATINFPKASTIVASAALLALSSATVAAADRPTNKSPSKEQKIGMTSGTAIGALIGGPFGAGVGFIVGTVAGVGAEQVRATAKHAKQLEQELSEVRIALANATEKSQRDAAASTAANQMTDRLANQLAQQLRGDILFRTDSATLDASTTAKLAQLGALLSAYPTLNVELDGFADPRGASKNNLELSQQRAAAVRAALIVGGAQSDRIKIAAHGAELSTAVKGDVEAYSWERRVSLAIVRSDDAAALAQAR